MSICFLDKMLRLLIDFKFLREISPINTQNLSQHQTVQQALVEVDLTPNCGVIAYKLLEADRGSSKQLAYSAYGARCAACSKEVVEISERIGIERRRAHR